MDNENKILIVDDDPLNIDILEEIFSDIYRVKSASSGEEALELLDSYRPDLILMDIMMPGIGGYETCRRIRRSVKHRLVKIILVSGKGMTEERLEGYEAGADDYVTKPFSDDELLAKANVFLRLKRTEEVDRIKMDILNLFSHETRTPLSSIVSPAELLLEDTNLTEDQRYLLKMIVSSSERLVDFINKTTLLCNLKGGQRLNTYIARPSDVVLAAKERLAEQFRTKNVRLSVSGDELEPATADWEMITHAITYIMDNAVKYSPHGAEVKADIQKESPDMVLYRVTDNGPGIDEENYRDLFEEFHVDEIMHHHKGLGISLSIARYVARAHGGDISLYNSETGGAVCEFRIKEQQG
ncbi:hybrid sensor histidine kinase/response regulator [Limisalsivibrio acetivorans]|uniref:hybrid sensor histidine kinase/response regulator n=1 Tax=Limisalsivibrio acetivorans TaxID=1304888 RepID=UPI0003B66BD0|nr:hybrid sensor histidine kinase/response regulator [Limisalsivibrio acetivorans]